MYGYHSLDRTYGRKTKRISNISSMYNNCYISVDLVPLVTILLLLSYASFDGMIRGVFSSFVDLVTTV